MVQHTGFHFIIVTQSHKQPLDRDDMLRMDRKTKICIMFGTISYDLVIEIKLDCCLFVCPVGNKVIGE